MIKALSEAYGVPGQEQQVRKLYQTYLEPVSEGLERDNFGSIAGVKTGDANGPKVLIAGHLDEIGMMVTYITDEGFIKFQTLGGWWSQVMLSQRVVIQTRKGEVIGVIGSKPPHVLPAEERNKVVKTQDMFIDIGVQDKAEAEEAGIRPGDAIVPWSPFTPLANGKYFMGKALDNRLGCATAVEVLRELQSIHHPNIVYAGATTQEEVGLRGAQTLVNHIKPDIAIALDVGIAGDTPGMTKTDALSRCGDGPIVVIYDAATVPNPRLRDFILDTAQGAGIPVQVEVIPGGGTDAGRFQFQGSGVPSVSIGYATRYIHSHAAVYHQDDFDNGVRLLVEVIKHLDRTMLEEIRQF
ncbi:M42 family metallopeptidase [Alicyclobacillus tolerans]|uniref:M42 family metallopeptidase n=1 Tax=Alicyclobacillus tolerans TaxID=90970 RepID=UPI001F36B795|nr:M42 family metallopeptidase [Alicyclobacillus tolerans]MCF8565376.1 M42 family metallopeptidase [Alicyclobacillus tolerans]